MNGEVKIRYRRQFVIKWQTLIYAHHSTRVGFERNKAKRSKLKSIFFNPKNFEKKIEKKTWRPKKMGQK